MNQPIFPRSLQKAEERLLLSPRREGEDRVKEKVQKLGRKA